MDDLTKLMTLAGQSISSVRRNGKHDDVVLEFSNGLELVLSDFGESQWSLEDNRYHGPDLSEIG